MLLTVQGFLQHFTFKAVCCLSACRLNYVVKCYVLMSDICSVTPVFSLSFQTVTNASLPYLQNAFEKKLFCHNAVDNIPEIIA